MKKVIISEKQKEMLESILKEEASPVSKRMSKPYTVNPDKVMIVKRYLDKGFSKGEYETIGADGFPCVTPVFGMLGSKGDVLKNMYMEELVDLLIDRYKKMFSDEDERSRFFNQVVKDWYNNRIGIFGSLSVNML